MNYSLLDVYDQLRRDVSRESALVITNYLERLTMLQAQQCGTNPERFTLFPQRQDEMQYAAIQGLKGYTEEENRRLEGLQVRELAGEIAMEQDWMECNTKVKEEYNSITEKSQTATTFKLQQQSFLAMLDFKKKMDEAQAAADGLKKLLDDKDGQILQLTLELTPPVPQMEVLIPNGEDQFKHGLFYKDKPLNFLAESELWEMYTQLCQFFNIRIIIVENINALGSGSIDKFNQFLANGGCYIFGSEMKRRQEKLSLIFHFNIP